MPIFKCIICKSDIERSRKVFIKKKGYILCSSCQDMELKQNKFKDKIV